jgi:hypothetical protein
VGKGFDGRNAVDMFQVADLVLSMQAAVTTAGVFHVSGCTLKAFVPYDAPDVFVCAREK